MFAVIKTGGKQYRVVANDVLKVEKIAGEPARSSSSAKCWSVGGDTVTLGAPTVAGATVAAAVIEQTRGPKVIAFKKRRRKNSRRKRGHRQDLTLVQITEILDQWCDADQGRLAEARAQGQAGRGRLRGGAEGDDAAPKAKAQGPDQQEQEAGGRQEARSQRRVPQVEEVMIWTQSRAILRPRLKDICRWLTKKQAAHPATGATPTASASA